MDKKKHSPDYLVKGRSEPCNIEQVSASRTALPGGSFSMKPPTNRCDKCEKLSNLAEAPDATVNTSLPLT